MPFVKVKKPFRGNKEGSFIRLNALDAAKYAAKVEVQDDETEARKALKLPPPHKAPDAPKNVKAKALSTDKPL